MVTVVAAALLFWVCVFAVYFTARGLSPVDFFLGAYPAHDPELAKWQVLEADPTTGLIREQRLLLPEGTARYLERQVRYRDPVTERIVKVEPPSRVRRARSRVIRP